MDYSLDDYVKHIGSLHQDDQVDACTEQQMMTTVDAAASDSNKRRRQHASTHIISLSHRIVGNAGLDRLVDALLNAQERQIQKKRRLRIDSNSSSSSSLQNDNDDDNVVRLANRIYLRCTNIKRGIHSLASLISRSNSTEVLDLSQNELGNEGITEFCHEISSQLHEQSLLHSLFLRNCQISCRGVMAIASLLKPQCHELAWAPLPIKTLDLSRNDIGNDGIAALAEAISWEGCSLQALDLSRCGITHERSRGLSDLCSAILSKARRHAAVASTSLSYAFTTQSFVENYSNNLVTLKLNCNDLGESTFTAIAACIAGDSFVDCNNGSIVQHCCPSLTNLYLNDTNMSSASATKLAKALATNTGLKIMNISGNSIDDDALKSFAYALRSNRTLSQLLFGRSKYITQKGVEALANCVYDERHTAVLLSLAASNHTITDFGLGNQTSIRLEHALQFNCSDNDGCSIQRKKIVSFLNRDCRRTVHHFAAMFAADHQHGNKVGRSTALPFVVSNCYLSCAFEMVRGMPESCFRTVQ